MDWRTLYENDMRKKQQKKKKEPTLRMDFEVRFTKLLADLEKIKALNKKYLKRNRPTDVLAFPEPESFPQKSKENFNLGEIIICPQQVKKNAKKYNLSFKKELARVLTHGILHLLGYNHEASPKKAKEMEKKENYYLSKI